MSAEECSESGSLLARAVSGSSIIPVEALVRFVRVAYSADQREVIELLANTLIQNTQVYIIISCYNALYQSGVCRCLSVLMLNHWGRDWS